LGELIPITNEDMVKYPFLPQVRAHIAESGLDIETLGGSPRVRKRAILRVTSSFDRPSHSLLENSREIDIDTEIAIFPLAVLYVAGVGDRRLRDKFAVHEAQQINRYLEEETREDVILEVARTFKWDIRFEKSKTENKISIPFAKYVENTTKAKLTHISKWKLVNRALDKGRVSVSPYEVARLLQVEVEERIKAYADLEAATVPGELQEDINELKDIFLKTRPQLEEFDQIVHAQESEYPPCINTFMKKAMKGEHLSHVERFTLVTYLLHQGISVDSIVSLFSNVSDFNEAKTRYQVENLAGRTGGRSEPYITYNCDTLQTHGACIKSDDPICQRIRNPLSYHLRKQRDYRGTGKRGP
jgi:DNA primase large subunit